MPRSDTTTTTPAEAARTWTALEIHNAGLLCRDQIYRLIRSGRLPATRAGVNRYVVSDADLQKHMRTPRTRRKPAPNDHADDAAAS